MVVVVVVLVVVVVVVVVIVGVVVVVVDGITCVAVRCLKHWLCRYPMLHNGRAS